MTDKDLLEKLEKAIAFAHELHPGTIAQTVMTVIKNAGYTVVPVEPTNEILKVVYQKDITKNLVPQNDAEVIYKTMIKAGEA